MRMPQVKYKIINVDCLSLLNSRQKKVLSMRCGILPYNRKHTLKEIAAELELKSTERVRQIEAKALRKLLHPSSKIDSKPNWEWL